MEKKKNVFGDIKSMLTRDQMKQVKGGSADIGGSGGCCAHTEGWTSYQCGYPDATSAQYAASSAAITYGVRTFYCCSSC